MPERGTAPVVLIDGPSAGQVIYTAPEVTAWYVSKPPEPLEISPALDLTHWILPEPIMYRFEWRTACLKVHGSPDPAWLRLRFGWSEPGEPDDRAVRRYGRAALVEHPDLMPPGAILWPADAADDEPIRILTPGSGPGSRCTDEIQQNPAAMEIRGTCPCGWLTEFVPTRRSEELLALTRGHLEAAVAWMRTGLGAVSYADYAELMGVTDQVSRRNRFDGLLASLDGDAYPASRRGPVGYVTPRAYGAVGDGVHDDTAAIQAALNAVQAPSLHWGEPLEDRDADWPEQGSTCAHLCGDAGHTCSVKATTHLVYDLPSGGKRRMPICGPCNEAETAAKETADA